MRIVFYREAEEWVAHVLEFDLVGTGTTKQEALDILAEAIDIQVHASADFGNWDNLFRPAEGRFLRMYAEGRDVAQGELELRFSGDGLEGISIEGIGYREYLVPDHEELTAV